MVEQCELLGSVINKHSVPEKTLKVYVSYLTRKNYINKLGFNRLNERNMSENLQLKVSKEKQVSHKKTLTVIHKY